jgi:outer membrane protein TolC
MVLKSNECKREDEMKKIILTFNTSVFILCLNISLSALQNNNAYEKIGINKAIQIALDNNHDYKIAVLKEREAREKVNAIWGQLLPVLESEVSAARQSAESGFMSMTDGQNDIKFVQLRFGINPGIFYNTLQLLKEANKTAVEELRRTRVLIEYYAIKAYFGVLLADEIIKLRNDSLNVLKTNLADVRNMYETGTVPRYDVLQAEVKERSQELALLEAESDYQTAIDTFNFILGIESIRYVPDDSVLKQENFIQPEKGSAKIERLTSLALKNRPELVQLTNKRDMMRYSRNINSSYYLWPTFSIAGSYGMTQYLPNTIDIGAPPAMGIDFSNITGTDEWQRTWQVRVAATYRWGALIPFDQTRAARREEALKLQEAELELSKLKKHISISIRSNYSELMTSYHTIISQKENINSSMEGLRIARESFKAGVLKNSELLSAELALTNARLGYINAVYQYYISLAELKKEIGIDNDSIILEEIK